MYAIFMRYRLVTAVVVLLAAGNGICPGQVATPGPVAPPAGSPQTAPAPQAAPAPQQPAALRPLDPKVQEVLARAREAYKAVQTYQDLGSVTTTMVVGGRPAESTVPASTTFARPGKFIVNYQAMSVYSDGQTLSIYSPGRGRYYQQPVDQPAAPAPAMTAQSILKNLPVLVMLGNTDQSLLSTTTAFESAYRGREQLAGKTVDHVTLISPADAWFGATDALESGANRVTIDMFLDAQTHMLLRLNMDLSGAMRSRITQFDQQRESPQLNQATWQFSAGQVRLGTPIAEGTFAFRVPANAEKVETVAALFTPTGGRPPINDEEEAEKREAEQSRLPYPAPDFSLADLAGETVKLSDLRGKVVVMDFWATWCGPCKASLPHIQKLHDDLKGQGVVVLGVDLGEDAKTVLGFAEKNKMTFRILLDEDDKVSPLYRVSAIPHTVVVDQKGQVVKVHTGFVAGQEKVLRSEVESLLGVASTQPAVQPATGKAGGAATTRPVARAGVVTTQPVGTQE